MKRIFLIFFGVIIIGLFILFIKGQSTQIVTTEIKISAPPEKVWNIITNVNEWQNWSPIIRKSNGVANLGTTLSIMMKGKTEEADGPQYNPTIIQLDKPSIFHWRAYMVAGFIMTNDKIIKLEPTPSGTRLIHKETFKGLLAPIFYEQMEKGIPPMLNSMNKALKELAEK